MTPEGYPPAMDSNVAKDPQGRDGGKARGGLPKHMQGQHGSSSKSDPKLPSPSPGELYHTSYSPAPGRSQHLLPPQLDNPSGRDESSTSGKEKTQIKQMSIQDPDDGSFGKTTLTAVKFINALIMQQMSCDKGVPVIVCLLPAVPLMVRCSGSQGSTSSPRASLVSLWPTTRCSDWHYEINSFHLHFCFSSALPFVALKIFFFINFEDHQECPLENSSSRCQKFYQTVLNKFSCVS